MENNPPLEKNINKARIGLAEAKHYLSEAITEQGDKVGLATLYKEVIHVLNVISINEMLISVRRCTRWSSSTRESTVCVGRL